MRLAKNEHGFSVIVSNEEYRVLRKIKSLGRVKVEIVPDYYQELADKLVSRGVLNKEEFDEEEYYTPVKEKK